MATNFATRYKKDLSIENLKAKLVRRKSILQKESRHKNFNKGRQFGLADVNTQHARDKELSRLEETGEAHSPEKNKEKPRQITNAKPSGQQRMEMLQRYKAEKELRKLKEQREKPVFKCGRYKPEIPSFLPQVSQIPVLSKPKEKVALPPARVTRSKTKNILEEAAKPPARSQVSTIMPKYTSKGSGLQPPQRRQLHIYVDKPAKKENEGVQPVIPLPTNGRITRATAAAMSKLPQPLKPAATTGNLARKRVTNKGKQQREIKNEEEVHYMKEDILMEPLEEQDNFQITSAKSTEEDEVLLEKENVPTSCIPALPPRRTRSFAPQNFVFKPLEGLVSYKVTPMTPSRANVFLSPDLTWSPTKTTSEVSMEDAKETTQQDCSESKSSPVPEVIEEALPEGHSVLEPCIEKMECASHATTTAFPSKVEISQPHANLPAPETSEATGEPQHDVPYFRNILCSETERLSSYCLQWDGVATMDIPEDAEALVRTTIGQTRLLIAERFKQFEGLVDNCEFRRGEKETTCSDLDGFWDMVAFQVEDVNKKFENLRRLQEKGWQMADDDQTKQFTKKKAISQRATRAKGESARKAAARKRLATIKAMMMNKMKPEGVTDEAASPEKPKEEEGEIMFDGGFFQVESPAKPFPGQTPKSARRSSRRASRWKTPRSSSRASFQSGVDTCITRVGLSGASQSCPPLPDLDTFLEPVGTDLLSCISEQSDVKPPEGSGDAVNGTAEETDETQTASTDSPSCSSDMKDLDSVDSQWVENPDVQEEDLDITEEVQQAATDLGEEAVVYSPQKDALSEGASSQDEEMPTPERKTGALLGDISYNGSASEGKPNLDCSLFITPLRNEAQKLVAAASDSDLIVFSPLSFPVGEK